jgi:hypothetical protein
MTDCIYTGAAAGVRQVNTLTIALTWQAADTLRLTIGGVDFTITIGSLVTTDQVATTIKQAFNGETLTDTAASYTTYGGARTIPQFRDWAVATVSASVITFTAAKTGKPITMTATETTAGNGTATMATPTVATGPNFADNADNWSNALAHGVRLIFDRGNVDCLYNLTLSIQPAAIIVTKGYRGNIGLSPTNSETNGYEYPEYRTTHLTSGDNSTTSTCSIGLGDGQGSRRINIDFGALQYATTVYGSGGREDTSIPAINLKGTNAANTLVNLGGDVGFALFPNESGHLATVRNSGPLAKTFLGSGVDLGDATISCSGGVMETNSATSTSSSISCTGGVLTINTGNQLTITVQGAGRVNLRNEASTITTLVIYSGAVIKETAGTVTFTNIVQLYQGATLHAKDGNIAFTNGFKFNGCTQNDTDTDFGENRTFTLAA